MAILKLMLPAVFFAGLLAFAAPTRAQDAPPDEAARAAPAPPAVRSAPAWFDEARLGLFITWGLYSQPAGEWDDRRYYGTAEWLMHRARIPATEYRRLADTFAPQAFDARAWVTMAREAGFKYIIITAKYHDGFAMWRSNASAFDVADATPQDRDYIRELADEARRQGLKIGFYYSQYQDWTEPDAAGNTWDPQTGDFDRYMREKAVPQLTELLTQYGDIGIIWFDTPQDMSQADAQALYDLVKRLQPDCMVSSRIGHGLGDYQGYADSEIPAVGPSNRPWEAIFTHNDSWGFTTLDTNFKSPAEVIRTLATVAGLGGNTLINIGPDGQGRMPEGSTTVYAEVGRWLHVNGEAIYETQRSPVGPVPFGSVTTRPGRLYLHVLEPPSSGVLRVPNVTTAVDGVGLLATGRSLDWRMEGTDLLVDLPDRLPDRRNTVIAVEIDGVLADSASTPILLSRDFARTRLLAPMATLSGATVRGVRNQTYFGVWKHFQTIEGLDQPEDSLTWRVRVTEPAVYRVSLRYAAGDGAGREGLVEAHGQTVPFQILRTAELLRENPPPVYEHQIGQIRFDRAGEQTITLRPRDAGTNLLLLESVVLSPLY